MPSPDPITLAPFGSELTIACAAAGRETLIDALCAVDGDLHLDLSHVADVDSSAIQLLLSARHSMTERGARLSIVKSSAAVKDALAVFGLDDLLAEPAHKD
jgi:anti-anti-sigma factor